MKGELSQYAPESQVPEVDVPPSGWMVLLPVVPSTGAPGMAVVFLYWATASPPDWAC